MYRESLMLWFIGIKLGLTSRAGSMYSRFNVVSQESEVHAVFRDVPPCFEHLFRESRSSR